MKYFNKILKYLFFILLWALFLFIGTGPPAPFSYFIKSGVEGESPADYITFVKQKANEANLGNVAVVLIENGKVADELYDAIDETIDENTLFNVASISKWVTTWAVLNLVEEGKLKLDRPANDYLTRWKLTSDTIDTKKVTIRSLLSHSSGLNREFDFQDNTDLTAVPTIEVALSSAEFVQEPESGFAYSNMGFGVLQLVIEEVSGLDFNTYMTNYVLKPLDMQQSTFIYKDTSNGKLATFYNTDQTVSPHFRYAGLAAHSLYTTPKDFTNFMLAHVTGNSVLENESIGLLTEKVHMMPVAAQGLGTTMYDVKEQNSVIIGHNGLNRWAINSRAIIDLETKDGVLIFCNGSMSFAGDMGDVWLSWKKGIARSYVQFANLTKMLVLLVLGSIIIITIGVVKNRRKSGAH